MNRFSYRATGRRTSTRRPSSRRPTINDVARAAGVSKGAVSFAFNDRPGIAPETRERILAAARELGWSPSSRARALSVSQSLAVGLVIARSPETLRSDPFFPAFIAGLESVLADHGYALLLQVTPGHENELASYQRLAAEGRVDGVVLTDLRIDDPRPGLLRELELPTVVIGPELVSADWPTVCVDDRTAIRAVVEHLIGLGHRRIAHVAGPDDLVHGRSRREAWAEALQAAGLPLGPCVEADFSAEAGAAATKELLDLADPPTAIAYANDLMAMSGLAVADSRGLDVPAQLSITGFDDTELAGYVRPSLTTVSTDVPAWGRAAAYELLALIDGRPAENVSVPAAELVVRESAGPPSSDHP